MEFPPTIQIGGDGTGMGKTVADLRASPRVNRRVYHRGEKHPDWCFSFTQYYIPTSGATKNLSVLGLADPSVQSE